MKKYKIGYCPTMELYASKIEEKIENIKMINYGSAAQVLSVLKNENELNGVLIGRISKNKEIDNQTKFIRLINGITLAYKTKMAIPEDQLKTIDVITYLNKEQVAHVQHFFNKIYFTDSLDQCLEYNLEIPILVDWKDFRNDFELLIPINDFGKTQEFRAPVLYYKNIDIDTIDKIKELFT